MEPTPLSDEKIIAAREKFFSDGDIQSCPIRTTLALLEGKWRILVISYLLDEPLRYGELKRKIPEISEKMLHQELRALEESGIVHRESYPEVPPRVEYSLTEKGKSLRPVINALLAWGLDQLRGH